MSDAATTGSNPADPGAAAPAATTEATTVLTAAPDTAAEQPAVQDTTTEAKPQEAADKPAEGEGEETEAKPEGAPEEYADFSMPEGVEIDAELGTDLKSLAKEFNLSQENAQKLADLGAKQLQRFQAMQADAVTQARATWEAEARADKEYGGAAFEENLGYATKAVKEFGNPALKTLLNQTGIGNHPEVIRFMVKAGKAISEDRFDAGRNAPQGAKTAAQVLYGNKET